MKKLSGFSLVEALTIIAIIGILLGTVIVGVDSLRNRSQDESRKADLKKLGTSLVMYRADAPMNLYPVSKTIPGSPSNTIECLDKNSPTGLTLTAYMFPVPTDNYNSAKCYYYKTYTDGGAYKLWFQKKSSNKYHIINGVADCSKWTIYFGGTIPAGEEIGSGIEDCQIINESDIGPS